MKKIDRESAINAINRWLNGEATANGIRAEFGLERVELENADDFFVINKAFEEIMTPIERVGTIRKIAIQIEATDLDEAIVKAKILNEELEKAKLLISDLNAKRNNGAIIVNGVNTTAEAYELIVERLKKEIR